MDHHAKIAPRVREAYPNILPSQLSGFIDVWLADNIKLGASPGAFMGDAPDEAVTRRVFFEDIAHRCPELVGAVPDAATLFAHLEAQRTATIGHGHDDPEAEALRIKLEGMSDAERFEAAIAANYKFAPTAAPKVETQSEVTIDETREKKMPTPKPFTQWTVDEQRIEVARRFGLGDPANVLPSKFATLRDAIAADEAKTAASAKQRANATTTPKTLGGYPVDSPEFLKLPPAERMRLARAAERGDV